MAEPQRPEGAPRSTSDVPSLWPGSVSPRPLPEPLRALLAAASQAEKTVCGSQRRTAFRVTRHLLGGAIALGFDIVRLAAVVGSSVASIRNRAVNGPIGLYELAALDLLPPELYEIRDRSGSSLVLASDLIRELLSRGERVEQSNDRTTPPADYPALDT